MSQKSKVASKTSGSTKAPVPAPRKAAQPVPTKGRSPSVDKKKASVTQPDSNKAVPSSTRSPSQPPDPKRTRDVSRHRETNRQERQKTTDGPANRAPKAKEAPLSKSLAVLQKSTATGPAGTSKKSSTGSRVDNSTTSRHISSEKKERNTEKKAVPASSRTSSKETSSKAGGRARLDAHQKDSKNQSRHEVSASKPPKAERKTEASTEQNDSEKPRTSTATITRRPPSARRAEAKPESSREQPDDKLSNSKLNNSESSSVQGVERDTIVTKDAHDTGSIIQERKRIPSEADESYNYDDDFEDYESDFEQDDDESDGEDQESSDDSNRTTGLTENVSEDKNCSHKSNEDAQKRDLSHWKSEPALDERKEPVEMTTSFSAYNLFNFASAKKKEESKKVLSKVQQRAKDVLEMVSLDAMTFQVLDIPPASYDAYIVAFGRANTKQALTQTDNINEEECQTDVIDVVEKWTQHPAHDYRGFGGEVTDSATGQIPSASISADAMDLFEFMQNSSTLMLCVLEEELSFTSQKHLQQNPDMGDFSTGFQTLNPLPFLKGCAPTIVCFSPASSNYIITGHKFSNEASHGEGNKNDLPGQGILCVWSLSDISQPSELLASHTLPTCCQWSPFDVTTVVSGSADGSLELWDLRDKFSLSKRFVASRDPQPDKEYKLKLPAYSTASILKTNYHQSPVVALHNVVHSETLGAGGSTDKYRLFKGGSFSVLSLDEEGVLNIWAVVETRSERQGSQTDLGLAPLAKLGLLRAATVRVRDCLPSSDSDFIDGLRTFDFECSPAHANRVLVATDLGCVLHCDLYGGKTSPKMYRSRDDNTQTDAKCLSCSPHHIPFFLVGTGAGILRLHSMKSGDMVHRVNDAELAVREWTTSSEVKSVKWSPSNPAAFFSLDVEGRVSSWDLSRDDTMPILVTDLPSLKVLAMEVGPPVPVGSSDAALALAMEDGTVQVHLIDTGIAVDDRAYELAKETTLNL